jgi:hypothetical protein
VLDSPDNAKPNQAPRKRRGADVERRQNRDIRTKSVDALAVTKKPQRSQNKATKPGTQALRRERSTAVNPAEAPAYGHQSALRCPICNSGMARVHRRLVDRVLNAGIRAHRLRCYSPKCGYEMFRKPQTMAARARPWVIGGALAAVAIALGVYVTSEVLALGAERPQLDRSPISTPAAELPDLRSSTDPFVREE